VRRPKNRSRSRGRELPVGPAPYHTASRARAVDAPRRWHRQSTLWRIESSARHCRDRSMTQCSLSEAIMNPRTLARVLSSCALTLYACSAVAATLEADLILDHGAIHVPTGVVSALAIKDGVIVAIGDESAVMASKGPGTKVTDLQGAAVIPGLHDMHVHPMGAGLSKLACTFPQGSGPAVVQAAVQQCAAKHKKG